MTHQVNHIRNHSINHIRSHFERRGGFDLSLYSFYVDPPELTDRVSGNSPSIVFDATAVSYDGNTAGANEALFENSGAVLFGGVVDQLIKKSEDISDAVWSKSTGVTVTGTDGFKADSQYDRLGQNVTTLDSVEFTISFMVSVEPGGQTNNYAIRHFSSATSNETVISISTTPTMMVLTVLGKSGGGLVEFGFQDRNTSNWAEVTITDFQVTASPYRLPYLANDSAVATISSALRYTNGTQGVYYDIEGDLLDSFAGIGAADAQGEMVTEWTPKFSSGDIAGDVNIWDIDETGDWILYDDVNNLLKLTDGVDTATVACVPVAGTKYEITTKWGDNSGQKMQIGLDGVYGSAVTNKGDFDYVTYLSPAWNTSAFQEVVFVSIKKEVT